MPKLATKTVARKKRGAQTKTQTTQPPRQPSTKTTKSPAAAALPKPRKPLTRAKRAARRRRPLFARRLREARTRVGLTQEKLGINAGLDELVASSRMNHYEQGVHEPDFTMILRLAKSLGVSAAFFFCEDDGLAEQVWEMTFVTTGK
jgi:ribosome-binding protein aMBF1 (putative translation factor)